MYRMFFKRLIDLLVAFIALSVLMPVILILIILTALANRGKPFFTQQRPGLHGRVFRVFKFKTMNDLRDSDGNLLPDKDRLTPVGRFIRSTSLDELPQLFNVLIGDMSLIGPRPLLVKYLPLYNATQARRHEVRPGITGWAQVNGRNAISWEQKFEYDVWYVDHLGFLLDIRILLMTLQKVVKRDGISAGNEATMSPFTGSPQG
jgi:undecaprenyl phosphate N,N'-diacetylbacillosamine 1-phosphate transferase